MKSGIEQKAGTYLMPMDEAQMADVLAIEKSAYSHPWTQGNFADALRSGYWAQVLRDTDGTLIGYVVAMPGVEETHLLNLTVAPSRQGQGWARHLLDALVGWSRGQGARALWLEVRVSNARARRLYVAYGFAHVNERKNYYPGLGRAREHAAVMRLDLPPLA
jgi:ribosomal-protein-alanine N-acetyltransferase